MSESPEITAPLENEVRLCACGSPRRPGAFDCKKCHREQMRRSRKHRRDQLAHLRRAVESLTIDNPETREKFEARSKTRWVAVLADPDEEAEDLPGTVTGFHPQDMLTVVDTDGQTHAVPLRKVIEDRGRRMPPDLLELIGADTKVRKRRIRSHSPNT